MLAGICAADCGWSVAIAVGDGERVSQALTGGCHWDVTRWAYVPRISHSAGHDV